MTKKTAMLGSEVRRVIAPVVRECPPECGVLAITNVDVSEDATFATVYISALAHPEVALEFLKKETPRLQHELGSLQRKMTPRLRFRIDEKIEEGNRIDDLLKQSAE